MPELARKKRVRAGHRASVTRMIARAMGFLEDENPDVSKLVQMKMSLQEKLDVLKQLDKEILELVEESEVANSLMVVRKRFMPLL